MGNKLRKIRAIVKEELEHIPKGDVLQNELREVYWQERMRSLGKKAKSNETKEDVLRRSIAIVKARGDFIMQKREINA